MKWLSKKGSRGIAYFMIMVLVFTSVMTGDVMRVKANDDPPAGLCQLSVTGYDATYGTVSYTADNSTWTQISAVNGVSNVYACAVKFEPAENYEVGSFSLDEGEGAFGIYDFKNGVFPLNTTMPTASITDIVFAAEGTTGPRLCKLSVAGYDATYGTVSYTADNSTWTQISAGNGVSNVDAIAVKFEPVQDYEVGSFSLDEGGGAFNVDDVKSGTFWLNTSKPTISITNIVFSQVGAPPTPCKLTVEAYDNTHGKIYYTAVLGGDSGWTEVVSTTGVTEVDAFRVKGVPTTGGYTASYTLNVGTTYADNIADNGEHGLLPEAGVNTLTNISFTNSGGGNNNPPPIVASILVDSYTNTHGKMQYSLDGQEWIDIPATGITTNTDAMFVGAVPSPGYSVSYKIDGNVVNDSNPHGFGSSSTPHNITDISFSLDPKNVTVSGYTDTYGTIQYSTNGTDWDDVSAEGATVEAIYVRAHAKSGGILDSYTLNNVVISTEDAQALTREPSNIRDVSFLPAGEAGGKYTINITKADGVNATTTIKFLDSSNQALATVSSGTEQEIPVNTAKIRIEVTGSHELLQTMQIERKDKDAPSDEHGTELAGRIAMEASIINDGYAEFAASAGYSYVINITFSNAKNVRWRYPEDRNHGDTSEDEIVEHAKLYRLLATSDNDIDVTQYSQDKDQMLTIGQTYYFLLVPDYGYQVSSLQINDGPLMAPISGDTNMGVFKFTMTNSNFHFKGIVSPANDIIVENSNAVTGATLADGANATDVGNVRMSVQDTSLDTQAVAYAGDGATAVATVDIDLEKVVSKGGSNGYWSKPLTTTSGDVTVGLAVPASNLSAGQTYSVVRNHDGVRTKLNATYNSTTEILEFPSNQFSDYTIVKIPGTPETTSETTASSSESKKDDTDSDSGSSSDSNNDNDNNNGSTGGVFANTLGSIVNKTATGGLVANTVIKDWNDLDKVLLDGNTNNASNKKKVLSDKEKARGELVQVVLNKKDTTVPASTFESLYRSNKSGLHVFVASGTALTFMNNYRLKGQKALDLSCTVTGDASSKTITFKTKAKLNAKTKLHTTVPLGVKRVTLYKIDKNGNWRRVRRARPTNERRICFDITELTTYRLVYEY